jgi:hypothetical protein
MKELLTTHKANGAWFAGLRNYASSGDVDSFRRRYVAPGGTALMFAIEPTSTGFGLFPDSEAKELASMNSDRLHLPLPVSSLAEEALIVDDRSMLSPAQSVENRLSQMLGDATIPVSRLQMRGLIRSR